MANKDFQKHIQNEGLQIITECLRQKLHLSCQKEDCAVLDYFADLTDEEVKGSMKVFARMLHCHKAGLVQVFQHIVQENERRKYIRDDEILGIRDFAG